MIFTVGVTSNHILDRDIELSFSTVDSLIAGESLDALKLMIAGEKLSLFYDAAQL